MASLNGLQERWNYLYQDYLPALAVAQDQAQKSWPVHLDHCFARIILDSVVGIDKPWMEVVAQPAVKNMSYSQLQAAIELAEKIATGDADLVQLDNHSLELRGKTKKRKAAEQPTKSDMSKKHKKSSLTVSSYFLPSPSLSLDKLEKVPSDVDNTKASQGTPDKDIDMSLQLKRIQNSNITAFRKQMLTLLCQIPRGRYSTYGAMANWISENSHKTCARAVGNAMRNNPFAPEVPCHRVLAGDGTLGGFKGSWGEEGKHAKLKHELLEEEGVKFDSRGKVKGPPFRDFSKS